ncbi:hypothetical protein CSUI_001309 [Cystoisospora suis]|uniref:Uncharacterized protein n=1 Tax=Cystoisospora suis TaxID=483139 RepID=A0A2C6LD70_9APIC|nr:hypothetical protein CSUI_001309 [Cystoisospora suis]
MEAGSLHTHVSASPEEDQPGTRSTGLLTSPEPSAAGPFSRGPARGEHRVFGPNVHRRLTYRESAELTDRMRAWMQSARYRPTTEEMNDIMGNNRRALGYGSLIGLLATTVMSRSTSALVPRLSAFAIGTLLGTSALLPVYRRRQWETLMSRPDSKLGSTAKELLTSIRGSHLNIGNAREPAAAIVSRPGAVPHGAVMDPARGPAPQVLDPREKLSTAGRLGSRNPDSAGVTQNSVRPGDMGTPTAPGRIPVLENTSESPASPEGWKLPETLDAWQPVVFGHRCTACDESDQIEGTKVPEAKPIASSPRYKTWDDVRREGLQPERRLNSWDLLRQTVAEQGSFRALR